MDMDEVLRAASELDVAVEINANPNRLDLSDIQARRAKELGVMISINTDAHSVQRLDHMSYGVDQARRAWIEKDDVLNTMTVDRFREWLLRREKLTA